MSHSNRALRYGVLGASVVAALFLLALFFPWNLLRAPLATYVSHRLERPVAIEGDLDVDLGRITRVQVDGVSIANVGWSTAQPMVASKRIVLWFTLRSLLRGEPVRARFVETNVRLERNADGDDNWHFGSDVPTPRIGRIDVDRSTMRIVDAKTRSDVTLDLQSDPSDDDARPGLRFTGKGTLHDAPLQVQGSSAGLGQLQDINDPYRLVLEARAGRTVVSFDGTVVPSDVENLKGALRLQGPDLSLLYPIVPAPLPWTPPYKLSGQLTHTAHTWDLRGMKGTVGDSDLKGDVRIDVSKPRSLMKADLTSARFDSKDLGGFIGLPPTERTQGKPTPEQQKEEQKRERSYRVLPNKPLDLEKLRAHDAEVRFQGTSVKWSAIPMDNLEAHLTLNNGVLRFEPLDFGIANGHIVANVTLDATGGAAVAQGEFEARNVELKRLFPSLASPRGTTGRFGGRAHFKTQGNSVAAMFAAVNGDAAVIMRGGEASTLQLVLTNLDLARAAALMLQGDQTADIRCAVAAVHAKDGVVTPSFFVIDTSAVVINGDGNVDLREEKYDLALTSKSKHFSLLALRGPIQIGGTFKRPTVGPAPGPVAARVGAAVGLGFVAPPLALLPLIDFGGQSDVDCRSLMGQAHVDTATTERVKTPKSAKQRSPSRERLAADQGSANGGRIR